MGNIQESKRSHKETEFRCITAVARERGCAVCSESEAAQWPDGWLLERGVRIPAEVVAAPERAPDEDPRGGSSWMLAKRLAEQIAAERTTQGTSYCIHEGELILLDRDTVLPVCTNPIRRELWVAAAVEQKLAKHYEATAATILIVHLHSPLPLDPFVLPAMQAELRRVCDSSGSAFKETWIVNDYDRPVQLFV